MPGKIGMRKTIKWDADTRAVVLAARARLADDGWRKITIRKVLYQLLDLPGWTKRHYDTLTVKLGEWRDAGLVSFGLFSDEGGGSDHTPMTPSEIQDALEALRNATPARLARDGYLYGVLVEHAGDVDDIAEMLDGSCVVSSQGQLRREHLFTVVNQWKAIAEELGARAIRTIMLVDYDKGGEDIFEAHRRWLRRIFHLDLTKWGVTTAQVRAAGLAINEDHQLEGWS